VTRVFCDWVGGSRRLFSCCRPARRSRCPLHSGCLRVCGALSVACSFGSRHAFGVRITPALQGKGSDAVRVGVVSPILAVSPSGSLVSYLPST
jgi:hypothetical protein